MLVALILVVFPFCMAFAAVSDTLSMTIANRVPVILVVTFALVAPLTGMEWSVYAMHFAGSLAVLVATFGLFALGGMGGGDAKLMAATAVYMGLGLHLAEYLVVSAAFGGALTLMILTYRKSPLSAFTGHNMFLKNFTDLQKGVPYGIALGAGGLFAYQDSPLMAWALGRLVSP